MFALIRRLRQKIFPSLYLHFLEEVLAVCDASRPGDGETVGSGVTTETTNEKIIRLMVGRMWKNFIRVRRARRAT